MEQPDTQPAKTPDPQPAPTVRTGSSWKNMLPGLFIGILVGVAGILFYQKHQPDITTALYTATWVLFGLLIITFLLFWGLRAYLTRFIFGSKTASAADVLEDAQRVSDVITERVADRVLADLPLEERARIKHILPRLANWFFWGRLRNWWWQWILGIFVSLGGITGTMLLMNQNELLSNQNALIQRQMSLEEASRRSALVVLMSNIMDKVDREIENQQKSLTEKQKESRKYKLSQSLIGQIAALSHSFKPYRYLNGDTLIANPLSPERGQLLITLALLPLDTVTFDNIYMPTTFETAALGSTYLRGAYLSNANLSEADLSEADIFNANLRNANLFKANLSGAHLSEADLNSADLNSANLSGAHLSGAELNFADLRNVDLRGANLREANLENTLLLETNLEKANLQEANLYYADLFKANLRGADLSRANLRKTNLCEADLRGANMCKADLSADSMYSGTPRFLRRESSNLTDANLSGANLNGANLFKADLSRADLSGADLRGANLFKAGLGMANLFKADLSGADLRGADLRGADLSGANLGIGLSSGCNFLENLSLTGKDLRGADLSGANLNGANLNGANLSASTVSKVKSLYQCEGIPDSIKRVLLKTHPQLFEKPKE